VSRLAARVDGVERGVIVAGFGTSARGRDLAALAQALGWPLVADAVSNARTTPEVVTSYEALVRVPAFAGTHRPELVLRLGAPLTSRLANEWLAAVPTAIVDEHDQWRDPYSTTQARVVAPGAALVEALTGRVGRRGPTGWSESWAKAESMARDALGSVLDADGEANEARVARDLTAGLPSGSHLAVASSLPVRALEWCMGPRDDITVHANRGANGIDGFVSTTVGIATGAAVGTPTVGFLGDLCFLHDTNGLLAARDVDVTFVVVDNRGGAIFSYLPQHELPEFEALFATPQDVDLVAVAGAHGSGAEAVHGAAAVVPAVQDAIAAGGPRVVVVEVDPVRSRERHRALWEAVAAALA
jgi:2-succinyl-5-enolpyruvyl-6-hydroxy-3-cyclohexene-1-carboxylate synthase